MTKQLERVVAASLQALADEARHADLRGRALRTGRGIRVRRRIAGGLGAIVAVVAIVTPLTLMRPDSRPPVTTMTAAPSPSVSTSSTASWPPSHGPTSLPEAPGAPSAIENPDLIAAEPGLLHFDVDLSLIPQLVQVMWDAWAGSESVDIWHGDHQNPARMTVEIATETLRHGQGLGVTQSYTRVAINGQEVVLQRDTESRWRLAWQPRDGLWVGITDVGTTSDLILKIARSLRLDRTQHCVQPLRVTYVPPGLDWISCTVGITYADRLPGLGAWSSSSLQYAAASRGAAIQLEPKFSIPANDVKDQFHPNTTAGGQPAQWIPSTKDLRIYGYHDKFELHIYGLEKEEAIAVVDGLDLVGDLEQPGTWLRTPSG